MNAPLRPRAWLPLVVFVVSVGGTLALAQPPNFPRGPGRPNIPGPPGNPQPNFPTPPQPTNPTPPPTTPGPGTPNGGMPGNGGVPGGGVPNNNPPAGPAFDQQKVWICQKCKHEWPQTGGPTPTRCPKCNTEFDKIVNEDGSTTRTAAGRRSLYIGLAVVGVAIIAAITKGLISMANSGGSKKKKKKKRLRPRDDDDHDDDYDRRPRGRRRDD